MKAILAGIPAEELKEPMTALSTRRKEIETQLAAAPAKDPIRLHPSMAGTYRAKIDDLIAGLSRPAEASEAKELIRGLIDRIVLTPDGAGLQVDLEGALASILLLSLVKQNAVVSRMLWTFRGGVLRAYEVASDQAARSSAIGSMG
ncbi:hypothetical protein [Acidimangrovimonas sediminis]|uniref:hypothetical protein n=1 Tax=Acidimangrovimonas sediminis TaxID=2056283 RepID=UPI000C7FBA9B|nr:hypothetical protein [Acidimangrovimonas sediminis]